MTTEGCVQGTGREAARLERLRSAVEGVLPPLVFPGVCGSGADLRSEQRVEKGACRCNLGNRHCKVPYPDSVLLGFHLDGLGPALPVTT